MTGRTPSERSASRSDRPSYPLSPARPCMSSVLRSPTRRTPVYRGASVPNSRGLGRHTMLCRPRPSFSASECGGPTGFCSGWMPLRGRKIWHPSPHARRDRSRSLTDGAVVARLVSADGQRSTCPEVRNGDAEWRIYRLPGRVRGRGHGQAPPSTSEVVRLSEVGGVVDGVVTASAPTLPTRVLRPWREPQ